MSRTEKAVALFTGGFACSQAVLAVFCERYGLDETMALRIATGFAGGMKCGEVCGAVSGAVMVVSLKYGHTVAEDREAKRFAGEKAADFMRAFRERFGGLTCKELLGCDVATPEGREFALANGLFATTCRDAVAAAVTILEEQGY